MDATSRDLFNSLVMKQAHELLETDIEFLKARADYLNADHRERFAEVLGLTKPDAPKKPAKKSD